MNLRNLLAIHRLQAHAADPSAVLKLFAAAGRNLADARVTAIGTDSRFDLAYKCVMQCAMLGLWAHGYRVSTNQPGHHQTAIQCLPLTLDVQAANVIVLDGLRKVRNVSDYQGDPVPVAALHSCLEEAEALLLATERWLRWHRPGWLP
jgi:hypothetical protein